MTSIDRHESGTHVALLDVEAGAGILVKPLPREDIRLSPMDSLHAADWDSITGGLLQAGWTFLVDEWDIPETVATLADGREVHALYPYLVEHDEQRQTMAEDQRYSAALAGLIGTFATRA